MKTHNSSRIIFSGHALVIKTITVYAVKLSAVHTLFGDAFYFFSSIVIATSTFAINIGLLISPTMISNGSPIPSPCIKQSASVVLSQWRALLRPSIVEVLKPFCCKNVRFMSCWLCGILHFPSSKSIPMSEYSADRKT